MAGSAMSKSLLRCKLLATDLPKVDCGRALSGNRARRKAPKDLARQGIWVADQDGLHLRGIRIASVWVALNEQLTQAGPSNVVEICMN